MPLLRLSLVLLRRAFLPRGQCALPLQEQSCSHWRRWRLSCTLGGWTGVFSLLREATVANNAVDWLL